MSVSIESSAAHPSPPLPSQLPIQRPPTCEIVLFVSQNYDKALLSLFRVAQLSLDAAQGTPAPGAGSTAGSLALVFLPSQLWKPRLRSRSTWRLHWRS